MLFNTQFVACLAACLATIPSASAAPLPRSNSGKRLVLWDWTNTRDCSQYPALKSSAQSIASAPEVFAVVNWGTSTPAELPAGVRFQPMVHGLGDVEGDSWKQVVDLATKTDKKFVHFLNEPEQNNIGVDDALAAWRNKMLPLRAQTNCALVSPAVASSPQGTAWLAEFMGKLSPEEKPNFVGTHFYTLKDTSAQSEIANAKAFFEKRISDYGIPLVVSEIASISPDATNVQTFTEEMAKYMDSNPQIVEYGFFGASRVRTNDFVSQAAQLLDDSGAWTALGSWLLNN